jgi:hypothetical protein
VGDGTASAAATQTDLQGSNKFRAPMEAGFPVHSDGTGSGAEEIEFEAVYEDGEANFSWEEWGIFNASSSGRMLNRKVEDLGTKAGGVWTLTITLSLAS